MAHVRTHAEDGEGMRRQGRVGMRRMGGRGHHSCIRMKKMGGVLAMEEVECGRGRGQTAMEHPSSSPG